MLEIDGSYGEGGGQVVRTALALSSVLERPFRIHSIRAGRSDPGLSHQHLNCVELMSRLTDADVSGCRYGSMEIEFSPNKKPGGEVEIDIGTAGSVSLLFQCLLPTLHVVNDLDVVGRGGTDVKWSPPIDYLKSVTRPLLNQFGLDYSVKVVKRGYYPEGGGEVHFSLENSYLDSARFRESESSIVKGVSHCGGLPGHIAVRQAESAEKILSGLDLDVDIDVEKNLEGEGKGSGIVLWTEDGCRVGGSSLGEPGKPAEEVGREAAQRLKSHIEKDGCVDKYAADQLLPTLAFAGGSLTTTEITSHTQTNAWLVNQFLGEEKIVCMDSEDGAGLVKTE